MARSADGGHGGAALPLPHDEQARAARWGHMSQRAEGMASLSLGSGPPLLFLPGLTPSHQPPHGSSRRFQLQQMRLFAEHRAVWWVNRRQGLPPDVSMAGGRQRLRGDAAGVGRRAHRRPRGVHGRERGAAARARPPGPRATPCPPGLRLSAGSAGPGGTPVGDGLAALRRPAPGRGHAHGDAPRRGRARPESSVPWGGSCQAPRWPGEPSLTCSRCSRPRSR